MSNNSRSKMIYTQRMLAFSIRWYVFGRGVRSSASAFPVKLLPVRLCRFGARGLNFPTL